MDAIINWIMHYGCAAIFCLLMLGIVGLPVPDEILLTFVGYLIFEEVLSPVPAALAAILGSICGITLSYLLGRIFGLPIVEKYGRYIHLKIKHLDKVRRWFQQLGKWTLTGGYFFPGVRHFTGFVAGTSKLRLPVFARYAYLGALCWAATFISLGYLLGEEWPEISERWLGLSGRVHSWAEILGPLILLISGGYFILRQRFWRRAASPVPVTMPQKTNPMEPRRPR